MASGGLVGSGVVGIQACPGSLSPILLVVVGQLMPRASPLSLTHLVV